MMQIQGVDLRYDTWKNIEELGLVHPIRSSIHAI